MQPTDTAAQPRDTWQEIDNCDWQVTISTDAGKKKKSSSRDVTLTLHLCQTA